MNAILLSSNKNPFNSQKHQKKSKQQKNGHKSNNPIKQVTNEVSNTAGKIGDSVNKGVKTVLKPVTDTAKLFAEAPMFIMLAIGAVIVVQVLSAFK